MRLIIAGGRDFNNYDLLLKALNKYCKIWDIEEIVCGEARGADSLGRRFAEENSIPVTSFKPNWQDLGKKAGILRNIEMGDYGTHLIAFWDGKSRGTNHMINYMKEIGKPFRVVRY